MVINTGYNVKLPQQPSNQQHGDVAFQCFLCIRHIVAHLTRHAVGSRNNTSVLREKVYRVCAFKVIQVYSNKLPTTGGLRALKLGTKGLH